MLLILKHKISTTTASRVILAIGNAKNSTKTGSIGIDVTVASTYCCVISRIIVVFASVSSFSVCMGVMTMVTIGFEGWDESDGAPTGFQCCTGCQ